MRIVLILILFLNYCNNDYETTVLERFNKSMEVSSKNFIVEDVNNFEFYVISDTHYSKNNKNILYKTWLTKNNKLFINGDITDNSSIFEFFYFINDSSNYNIYTVIGNHDISVNINMWVDTVGPTTYKYEIGETLIIILDTANKKLGKLQTDWLIESLSNNFKNKIIITHIPPWMLNDTENEKLLNILYDYNVNLYINGHCHYFLTRKIDNTFFIQTSSIRYSDKNFLVKILIFDNEIYWEMVK